MEKKGIHENIIVAILMVLIVVGLLVFVGFNPIKEWLSTPFQWKEPEDVGIYLIDVEDFGMKDRLVFEFVVANESPETITEAVFEVQCGSMTLEWELFDIERYDTKVVRETKDVSSFSGGLSQEDYEYFQTVDRTEVPLTYRTLRLETEDGTVIKNNGTVKIITILAVSLVLWLIGLLKVLPKWLRIILKTCGLPALAVVGAVILLVAVLMASRGSTASAVSERKMEDAQQRYKRAASLKAGAVSTGSTANAARAQAEMDRAMSDMIGATGSSDNSSFRSAQQRYNRAASQKAGAQIQGNKANAARAQAEMDRAMADMIKNK